MSMGNIKKRRFPMQKSEKCNTNLFCERFSLAGPPNDFFAARCIDTFVMLLMIFKSHKGSGHYCDITQ
jgi:hypothetical protein